MLAIDRRVVGAQFFVGHDHVDAAMFGRPATGIDPFVFHQRGQAGRFAK
jgi:hypothetical protein